MSQIFQLGKLSKGFIIFAFSYTIIHVSTDD